MLRKDKTQKSYLLRQRGEGESNLLFTVLGGAIFISAVYYGVQWILEVKAERNRHQQEVQKPPPKSVDDVGGYEAVVKPIF